MKTRSVRPAILKNQKGFLTLDFIFATLLMFSFSAILFMFTITFSAMEIAQYAVFASARTYFAANKDEEAQEEAAKAKFTQLIRDPKSPLGTLFKNGWFTIDDVTVDDFNEDFSNDPDNDSATFIGARTTVRAKILQMKFPVFGGNSEELSASPAAYLMREPTEKECTDFSTARFGAIKLLKSGFAQSFVDDTKYAALMDDGC